MSFNIHKQGLGFLLAFTLLFGVSAWGQSAKYKRSKSKATKSKQKYKVDISDVEKKYWAPKDTDFSVVQSRTYSKDKRYSLSLQTGPLVNDSYSSGLGTAITGNYFFSERYGMQLSYLSTDTRDNDTIDAFLNDVGGTGGVKPDYGRVNDIIGASFNWVPVYAKMSLLGQKIIYFDMAISPGLAMVNYDQIIQTGNKSQSAVGLTLDVTQYFFLSKNLVIRADLKNTWYQEKVVDFRTGTSKREQTVNNSFFLMGLTYYFN